MTGKDIRAAASVLYDVTEKGAYVNIALQRADNAVRMLVYGVMEKYFALTYAMGKLCDTLKTNLRPYMLAALYCVMYTDTPFPVVVGATGEALESAGKGAVKGFFTAVLAKADRGEVSFPAPGKKGYEEIRYNMPSWLIGMYKKEFPDRYGEIIDNSEGHRTHVVAYCDEQEILAVDPQAERTKTGYFIRNGADAGKLFTQGKTTYMSLGSTLVCEEAGDVKGKKILDCCAAPGGKAVYLAKKGGKVTACDVHEHRLTLIRSYAQRMGVKVDVEKTDATERKDAYVDAFDMVLCDVPCSGLGVIDKKRDIIFNRTYEDIIKLSELQRQIIDNCAKYVKKGGILLYSTCTLFSKENDEVVDGFLEKNNDFVLETKKRFLPDGKGMEGFFVCRMRRN